MVDFLNDNTGVITALATVALLLVTGWYAWTTRALLREAKVSRLLTSQPRVVSYLRIHKVHTNIAQLCIANLSGGAAINVSAVVNKVTEWPDPFDLEDSTILRDLSFMRPHEVLTFDIGHGPDLFRDNEPAVFEAVIHYEDVDNRSFKDVRTLAIESVSGHSHWQIYGLDDISRRLTDISKTLDSFSGFKRLKVDVYSDHDRQSENILRRQERKRLKAMHKARGELPDS